MPLYPTDLAGVLRRGALQRPFRFLSAVAEAVEAIHSEGIMHRDIKPENVLIDDLGRPAVADLGICRQVPTIGHATEGVGTAGYRPTEMRGGRYGTAVDIHAFGQVVRAVAGRSGDAGARAQLDEIAEWCRRPQESRPTARDVRARLDGLAVEAKEPAFVRDVAEVEIPDCAPATGQSKVEEATDSVCDIKLGRSSARCGQPCGRRRRCRYHG
jgi:hypothetical protein